MLFWKSIEKKKEPELTDKDDPKLIRLMERYHAKNSKIKKLDEQLSRIKEQIYKYCAHSKIKAPNGTVITVKRGATVNYGKVPILKHLPKEYLEEFRGEPIVYRKITTKE